MSKNAVNSSMWMMGLSIGEKAFSFAIYVILARLLDILEFGVVAFCVLFLDFLAILITTGVREYIVTRKDISKLLINTCFISVSFIAIVVVTLFLQLFTLFLPEDSTPLLEQVFQVLIFLPLFSSINTVQIALLQREFEFKQLAIRSLISTVVAGSISVWFAYDGYGAWSLVIYKFGLVILDTIILFYITRFLPTLQFSFDIVKDVYRFCIPLLLSEVFNFWSSRVMQLFVSVFFGPASFALLDIAKKFSTLITQVSLTALRPVCLSFVSKAPLDEKGKSHSAFSAYIAFFIAPALIAIGVYADGYVTLIFGEQWVSAIDIIEILSFAALAQCLTWYFPLLLIVNQKNKQVFILNIVFFTISIIAGLLSYKLSFLQYIAVQVGVINILTIFKIFYLWKKRFISVSNIIIFYVPVIASTVFFASISVLFKLYIFEPYRANSIIDLIYIAFLTIFAFSLYLGLTFVIFKRFFQGILNTLKSIRGAKVSKSQDSLNG